MEGIAGSIRDLQLKHLNQEHLESVSDSDTDEEQLAFKYILELCQQACEKNQMSKKNALVKNLESCLRLNEAYQENYRLTKDKLLTMPKGKAVARFGVVSG